MGDIILHHRGAYNIYSTVSDGCRFVAAITGWQLRNLIREEQGQRGLTELPGRLERAHAAGHSCRDGGTLQDFLAVNRAGPRETFLPMDEFITEFLTLSDRKDPMNKDLPQYLQRKIIQAAKILRVEETPDGSPGYRLHLEGGETAGVSREWRDRMLGNLRKSPLEGCYYVLYPDGYTSVSPAEPFERGNVALADLRAQDLKMEVEGGRLVISIGVQALAKLGEQSMLDFPIDIHDPAEFATAVIEQVQTLNEKGIPSSIPGILTYAARVACIEPNSFSTDKPRPE